MSIQGIVFQYKHYQIVMNGNYNTLFNFSVPGGKADYTLQWMEKFKRDDVKPDFILFDHSIELYNSAATLKVDETLTSGLDVLFVLRHFDLFTTDEISTLIAKRMFRTYQYRPKLGVIIGRAKNKDQSLYPYRKLRKDLLDKLNSNRGSARTPGTLEVILPAELLKKSALGDFNSYLVPFQFSEQTLEFLNQSIQISKSLQIPSAAIWVRVSRPYVAHMKTMEVNVGAGKMGKVYDAWLPKILAYHENEKIPFWNMIDATDYSCDEFSDAGHMSPSCYPEYTHFIMQRVTKY